MHNRRYRTPYKIWSFIGVLRSFRQNDEEKEARVMQVQSNLGPAGIGSANVSSPVSTVESTAPPPAPPPPAPVDAPDPVVEREAAQAEAQAQATQQRAAAQAESRAVAPRARLTFDSERSEVFVEVLNPSNGDVLFSFPAKEADQAFSSGLTQGSLVDQYA
jgi:type IV secretory pathway VirB10-like protein